MNSIRQFIAELQIGRDQQQYSANLHLFDIFRVQKDIHNWFSEIEHHNHFRLQAFTYLHLKIVIKTLWSSTT